MNKITQVKALPGYRLSIRFDDGVEGEIALEKRLFGPMFEPLKDENLFSQVSVDTFGAICWPNGADLAPDHLYRQLKQSGNPGQAA